MQTKSGDHFIHDQQRAVPLADFLQSLQETHLRGHHSHIGSDRLDDHPSDLILVLEKDSFDRLQIVIRHVQRQRCQCRRHSRAFGNPQRRQAGSGLRQEAVRMSVVTTLKFDDEIAFRHAARQPHRAHRGFRAARDKANLFNKGNRSRNQRGQLQLQLGGHAKAGAAACLVRNRFADARIRVAEDHGAPGAHIIQQLVPIRIVEMLPAAAFDNQRLSTDGTERPHGTIHAADKHLLGALENFARTRALAFQPGLRCTHVFSLKLARLQPACGILGMVGENDFGTRALDACQDFQHHSLLL